MNSALLLALAIGIYLVAYLLYTKVLNQTFVLDPSRKTPAHTKRDGQDFEPAKNWLVLFGHHFASICGAGPIIGPTLACIYWGWGASFLWILVGAIWLGAVADFSALIMSVRSEGKSIAQISRDVISPRASLFFLIFIWIALILVIAVFSILAAQTFTYQPETVLPSFGLIPTAILIGWLLYKKNAAQTPTTLLGLLILVALLICGHFIQITLPSFSFIDSKSIWILLLLIYCFVASIIPVQTLLQPRDYLASFVLFAMIGVAVIGIFITHPEMQAPAFNGFNPLAWPKAGPVLPMLFVTVACGAISGFHSLVASGTTCKQLDTEAHACRVGYGGMLTESFVACLVLLAVGAGVPWHQVGGILKTGGPISVFSEGYGAVTLPILGPYGKSFAVLALNAFILTTLDSATRITRYVTSELFRIENRYVATLIPVVAGGLLALSGKWNIIWPIFGTSNQLIAALTLLVASCWLHARKKKFKLTFIPAVIMLIITLAAFSLQLYQFLMRKFPDGSPNPDWLLASVTALLIALTFMIIHDIKRSNSQTVTE